MSSACLEPELAVRQVDHLNARAGQRLGGGQHVAVARGDDGGLYIRAVDEHVVDALRHGLVHAHAGGGVRLRVKVAQQHAPPRGMQRGGQIDGGRRLAHAAFLVYKRNDPRHTRTHFLFQGHPVQKFFRTIHYTAFRPELQ